MSDEESSAAATGEPELAALVPQLQSLITTLQVVVTNLQATNAALLEQLKRKDDEVAELKRAILGPKSERRRPSTLSRKKTPLSGVGARIEVEASSVPVQGPGDDGRRPAPGGVRAAAVWTAAPDDIVQRQSDRKLLLSSIAR